MVYRQKLLGTSILQHAIDTLKGTYRRDNLITLRYLRFFLEFSFAALSYRYEQRYCALRISVFWTTRAWNGRCGWNLRIRPQNAWSNYAGHVHFLAGTKYWLCNFHRRTLSFTKACCKTMHAVPWRGLRCMQVKVGVWIWRSAISSTVVSSFSSGDTPTALGFGKI